MNDRDRDGAGRNSAHTDGREADGRGAAGRRPEDDITEAVRRFEQAVEGLASTARDRFGNRASRFINDATSRLEREVDRQSRRQERRERRRQRRANSGIPAMYLDESTGYPDDGSMDMSRDDFRRRGRSGRLFRNRQRRKIAGVCSGIASYLGVQTWVVRGATITGALFFPMIVIPAYFIAMVFLPEAPRTAGLEGERAAPQGRSEVRGETSADAGTPRNVRRDFKDTQSLLSQAELRLRRMEAHVTSDRYELQKELHRLEHGGKNGGAVA